MDRGVKMLGIEATLATPERARSLGIDHEDWMEIMYAGCMADYSQIAGRGTKLAHAMSGDEKVRITSPQGTDLTFKLDHRPVKVSDGIVTEAKARAGEVVFLPAGDVEVSADEESAEGKVVYDVPIYSRNGTMRGLSIRVVHGRIAEYTALYGSDVFKKHVESGGDADRFAFFGFGLNPNLRHGFTQDDKVLGGVTVGFGENEAKGGSNRANQDWWGSITHATVEINGQVIMKDGNLLG
jgi:leucyl aminopeptidase (aminopeptidase T)